MRPSSDGVDIRISSELAVASNVSDLSIFTHIQPVRSYGLNGCGRRLVLGVAFDVLFGRHFEGISTSLSRMRLDPGMASN